MTSSLGVAGAKREAAVGRSAGRVPAQGRTWTPAPRAGGSEAEVHCRRGHQANLARPPERGK